MPIRDDSIESTNKKKNNPNIPISKKVDLVLFCDS
jgi:hypothetical protein